MLVYYTTLVWYLLGYTSCNCQLQLMRSDPGENVSTRWNIPATRVDQYHYISIHHNKRVILFCMDPFTKRCQVNLRGLELTSSPRVADDNPILNRLGFDIFDVASSDAGHYTMEAVTYPESLPLNRDAILYVYETPTKPIIQGMLLQFHSGSVVKK